MQEFLLGDYMHSCWTPVCYILDKMISFIPRAVRFFVNAGVGADPNPGFADYLSVAIQLIFQSWPYVSLVLGGWLVIIGHLREDMKSKFYRALGVSVLGIALGTIGAKLR